MTVSRVLNGHPNIRASTRERVLRAIDEMNYTRSSIARALATSRSMRIGVLVDAPVEYGPNSTLRAIERAAREVGYAVSSFSTADDAELSIDNGVVDLVTQGVDGLCIVAPRSSSLDLLHRQSTGLPTLAVTAASEARHAHGRGRPAPRRRTRGAAPAPARPPAHPARGRPAGLARCAARPQAYRPVLERRGLASTRRRSATGRLTLG